MPALNCTPPKLPPLSLDLSVPARFHQIAALVPDQPAVVNDDRHITYAALDTWSDRIAEAICACTGARGAPVALLCAHGPATLAAMLGTLKAGGIYCVVDPAMPIARLSHILADLKAELVLADREHLPLAHSLDHPPACVLEVEASAAALAPLNLPSSPAINNLAAIYYSSGTTGRPKGVVRDHMALVYRAWVDTEVVPLAPGDAVAWLYSAAYSASVADIFGALFNGAALHVYRLHERGINNLAHWLESQRIVSLHLHASVLNQLLNTLPQGYIFQHLRYVRPSDRVAIDDLRRLRRHLPPGAVIAHSLGSSETGPVTRFVCRYDTPLEGETTPVGFPLNTVEISLLNEAGEMVSGEDVGEIVVRSRYLACGYWNQPELTAQCFQIDPDDSRYRIYRMGDIARWRPDGLLELVGRNDRRVKIRGYTVDLGAIDSALSSLPSVREAVTIVQPASGGATLIAYVCPAVEAVGLTSSLVREALAHHLPDYMLPARFVLLEVLPLLSNGKVDHQSLPPPGKERPQLDTPFIAPRTEIEQQLAAIWAELLELDEVGIEDNFFELGGDSLLAMRLLLQVENQFGCQIPPDFFRQPTIVQLTRQVIGSPMAVDTATAATASPFPPRKPALRHRLKQQVVSVGPLWRRYALPYGLGVRLQQYWFRLPPIQQRLQQACAILETWQTLVGRDDPTGQEKQLSILANTWRRWREACLWQPEIYRRWVSVKGWDNLESAQETGRPIIIVGTHTAIKSAAMKMAVQQRTGRSVWTLGYSPTGQVDAVAKVITAQRLISEGGIVHITGDGAQGNTGLELPFFNRFWLFRTGGAELALDTNAILLPAFNTLAYNGQITIEFLPPFTTLARDKKAQIEDLTRQYAQLLTARWPNLLSNMKWDKLQQFYNYGLKNG